MAWFINNLPDSSVDVEIIIP